MCAILNILILVMVGKLQGIPHLVYITRCGNENFHRYINQFFLVRHAHVI